MQRKRQERLHKIGYTQRDPKTLISEKLKSSKILRKVKVFSSLSEAHVLFCHSLLGPCIFAPPIPIYLRGPSTPQNVLQFGVRTKWFFLSLKNYFPGEIMFFLYVFFTCLTNFRTIYFY